jgi:hypothetical protein
MEPNRFVTIEHPTFVLKIAFRTWLTSRTFRVNMQEVFTYSKLQHRQTGMSLQRAAAKGSGHTFST